MREGRFILTGRRPAAVAPSVISLLLPLLATLLFAGCATHRPPVLEPLRDVKARTPVVLIPGITGTRLRDRETGRTVWGNSRSIFFPRDGGYRLALPIDLAEGERDSLEAGSLILHFRLLGLFRFEIYGSLIRLMEANGYRLGDLNHPRPDDTFFLFPYDWRHENLRAVQELAELLERLRQVRGDDVLRVNFICQSNAGRIARYFIKYGAAPLAQAESGTASRPSRIEVDKLILVGAANGGALSTLEELCRGRSYLPILGRKFLPETSFTYRSVYEELPAYRRDLFFDSEGRPLAIDLFDAANWETYGWSVWGRKARKRLSRTKHEDLFGDEKRRAEFLAESLDRAHRLHDVLSRDVRDFGGTEYYLVQNVYLPTPERALLLQRQGEWRTLYGTHPRVSSVPYLQSLASAPGDRHATLDSLFWLSPQERKALAAPPAHIPAVHRKIILSEAAHRWILSYLLD